MALINEKNVCDRSAIVSAERVLLLPIDLSDLTSGLMDLRVSAIETCGMQSQSPDENSAMNHANSWQPFITKSTWQSARGEQLNYSCDLCWKGCSSFWQIHSSESVFKVSWSMPPPSYDHWNATRVITQRLIIDASGAFPNAYNWALRKTPSANVTCGLMWNNALSRLQADCVSYAREHYVAGVFNHTLFVSYATSFAFHISLSFHFFHFLLRLCSTRLVRLRL